jgi:hypothetical protein
LHDSIFVRSSDITLAQAAFEKVFSRLDISMRLKREDYPNPDMRREHTPCAHIRTIQELMELDEDDVIALAA